MINKTRNTISKALFYLREWKRETELSERQLKTIKELQNEIEVLCNSDLCPPPQTEFQKLEQVRELQRLYETEDAPSELTKICPQNEELFILSNMLFCLLLQISRDFHFRLSTLSENASKAFWGDQAHTKKPIITEETAYQELIDVLFGRSKLAEELMDIEYKEVLRQWCHDHSAELYTKVNAQRLCNILKVLKPEFNLQVRTFTNWIAGK